MIDSGMKLNGHEMGVDPQAAEGTLQQHRLAVEPHLRPLPNPHRQQGRPGGRAIDRGIGVDHAGSVADDTAASNDVLAGAIDLPRHRPPSRQRVGHALNRHDGALAAVLGQEVIVQLGEQPLRPRRLGRENPAHQPVLQEFLSRHPERPGAAAWVCYPDALLLACRRHRGEKNHPNNDTYANYATIELVHSSIPSVGTAPSENFTPCYNT